MYRWTAIYNDETLLTQFEGEKENLFKDIDQNKLVVFGIDNEKESVIVNLKKGTFMVNGKPFEIPGISNREEEYRLIYFRRKTASLGMANNLPAYSTETFVGFQVTIGGQNKQIMFSEKNNIINLHFK